MGDCKMELVEILLSLSEKDRNLVIDHLDVNIIMEASVLATAGHTLKGGVAGAGVGAAGAGAIWAYKRLQLRKKWKKCEELPIGNRGFCKEQVEKEIKALNDKAKKQAAAAALVGAALAATVENQRTRRKNAEKRAKEAESESEEMKTERDKAIGGRETSERARRDAISTITQLDQAIANSLKEREEGNKRMDELYGQLEHERRQNNKRNEQAILQSIKDLQAQIARTSQNAESLKARRERAYYGNE